MAHLELIRKKPLSSFRKLSLGSWGAPYDPTVYGTLTVRMDEALAYMAAFRRSTGLELTVTHLVLKALAEALRRCPDANAVVRFGRIYLRQRVSVSALVASPGPEGGARWRLVRVEDADRKSLEDVVRELGSARDEAPRVVEALPAPLTRWFLTGLSFLATTLNLDLSRFGLPKDVAGGAVVADVGALGLDAAYLPLIPFARVPVFVAPGAVREVPVVEEGRVGVGRVMSLNASIDHRFIDGFHAGVLARALQALLEDPAAGFGPVARGP
ncbi:2-oxo acid dehydrogenase subunit E2 [Myxococcus sp. K15C18031901]|uniref:2-oxo acid dehydrogenase subunit E2 n=1 Tax=Myxococcus dinghuensis TaxID=2906761 RepID=UPI0020A6EFC5|nr:2-oxo acid dehydrogenase subunit E2 [Myxococcus dinghuensis]MCP3100075.1 2-oxo acid dehydrogenase subunit E2 [Myxococcus dinghuensis]